MYKRIVLFTRGRIMGLRYLGYGEVIAKEKVAGISL